MTQCTPPVHPHNNQQTPTATEEWRYIPAQDDDSGDEVAYEAMRQVMEDRLYAYLCLSARADGFVLFEIHEGFTGMLRASVDAETAALIPLEQRFGNYDDESWILFDARENLDSCLRNLHYDGKIEWVIRDGWPWLRVPDAASHAVQDDRTAQRRARLDELRTMPYREYLVTPEWQQRRHLHLENAGHRCQVCSAPHSLHVHHRTYLNRGNERFSDLTVLCATCHKLFHDHGKVVRP